MKIEGVNPETGEPVVVEISNLTSEELTEFAKVSFPKKKLAENLDRLDVSADIKAGLYEMGAVVIRVGEDVIRIGQKILEAVLRVIKMYPNTSFGLVFGIIAGVLISTIPLIGGILGSIVMPILAVLGMTKGFLEDIKDKALASSVRQEIDAFACLKG